MKESIKNNTIFATIIFIIGVPILQVIAGNLLTIPLACFYGYHMRSILANEQQKQLKEQIRRQQVEINDLEWHLFDKESD